MSSEEVSAKIYALGEALMNNSNVLGMLFKPEKEGPCMDILATIKPGKESTEVQIGGMTWIMN